MIRSHVDDITENIIRAKLVYHEELYWTTISIGSKG